MPSSSSAEKVDPLIVGVLDCLWHGVVGNGGRRLDCRRLMVGCAASFIRSRTEAHAAAGLWCFRGPGEKPQTHIIHPGLAVGQDHAVDVSIVSACLGGRGDPAGLRQR